MLLKNLHLYRNLIKLFLKFKGANKNSIKKSIEKIFKVNVIKINTINIKGKNKNWLKIKNHLNLDYKKAIVNFKKRSKH